MLVLRSGEKFLKVLWKKENFGRRCGAAQKLDGFWKICSPFSCMLREGLAGRDESGESCFEEAVRSTPDQPPRSWLVRFSERDSESRGGHSTGKCRTCCVCSRLKPPQRIYRWELLSPLIPVRPRLFSKATPSQWIATRSARLQ
jgi:hypothetical protein